MGPVGAVGAIGAAKVWRGMFLVAVLALAAIAVVTGPHEARADGEPAGFTQELLLDPLRTPTSLAFLPDGRMLVTLKEGDIIIDDPDDPSLSGDLYLSIPNVATAEERGLVAIAVDPEFESGSPYIYVYYPNDATVATGLLRVSRFTHLGDHADASSEVVIFQDPITFTGCCHTGGLLQFGPDGMLWLAIGDKTVAENPQSDTSYGGKVIRIDKDGSTPPEIWAKGLRNPWKGAFDPLTGKLWIGEVGQDVWEDVNVIDPDDGGGENFGWPFCDGPCGNPAYDQPFYSYPQLTMPWTPFGASLTGGVVYRGNAYPSVWQGRYFFADYVNNWIRYLTIDANGDLIDPGPPGIDGNESFPFAQDVSAIVDLKEGPDGMLYTVAVIRHGTPEPDPANSGFVSRIAYNDGNSAPVITLAQASPTQGPSPLTVTFSGAATDAETPGSLTYRWIFDDGTEATGANLQHTYTAIGMYQPRLSVSDGINTTLSDPITIQVGDPPNAVIATPLDGTIFRAGDVIPFAASTAGNVGTDTYTWTVLFTHSTHTHPALGPLQGTGGQFIIPTSGHSFHEETSYQFHLTVTDSAGLTASDVVTVYPDKVDLDFTTSPPGLTVMVDGIPLGSPVYDTLIDFRHTISVADQQCRSGILFGFVGWSDDGARSHDIVVPAADAAYTASFTPLGTCSGGVDDVGMVDPTQGLWSMGTRTGPPAVFYYGNPGDYPIVGDWDCDGIDTPGLYRQSDGFVYLRNSNTQGVADIRFFFGNPGDIPLSGDFDGDGCDTVSIYRPAEAKVFVINELGSDEGGLGAADVAYYFGNPGDKPFVGDFDGDVFDTVGLHRESTGLVYFRNSHTEGVADAEFIFGDPGDRLTAGDWTGSGSASPGLFRPSTLTVYLRYTNTAGNADEVLTWTNSASIPVAGHFGP